MTQFYRAEWTTLVRSGACDQTLIGQAELLRVKLDRRDGAAIVDALPVLEDGLAAIEATLRNRQAILFEIE